MHSPRHKAINANAHVFTGWHGVPMLLLDSWLWSYVPQHLAACLKLIQQSILCGRIYSNAIIPQINAFQRTSVTWLNEYDEPVHVSDPHFRVPVRSAVHSHVHHGVRWLGFWDCSCVAVTWWVVMDYWNIFLLLWNPVTPLPMCALCSICDDGLYSRD